ncbi:MAG: class I SAM-dependent RNA methyltransferase [Gemmatimonadetes bacterium]|nr:MAG: class I SAM-dependent RNA methyltransferase [Gemmatimonadota bacterium]
MKYLYQQHQQYFAQTSTGIESLAAEELTELGATQVKPVIRGVIFQADNATLYRINYGARLVMRVIAPLIKFECTHPERLYQQTKKINWSHFFQLDQTFAVFANVSRSRIRHSQYAGLKVKDAIADSFRERYRQRPNVNPHHPDVWVNVHIHNDIARLGIDTSGGSLHQRKYRQQAVHAPMQETLAAAIIRLSQWDGSVPLYDPMCGSGTLLAEALMHYCRIPAGLLREKFGFEQLPDFDQQVWHQVEAEANQQMRQLPQGRIQGSDIDPTAIQISKTNLRQLPEGRKITLARRDFRELPGIPQAVIVCNPPYGIRLGKYQDLIPFYQEFGTFLREKCAGSTAYIYTGDPKLVRYLGLKKTWQKKLNNGKIKGILTKFYIY